MDPFVLKVILFVTIGLCIYILFQLLQKRNSYYHIQWQKTAAKEGFLVKSNIVPINDEYAKLRLKQYVIKASFNSAYGSDGQISNENLKRIIDDEGVRFLDFGIYEQNKEPVVGHSNSYGNTIGSNNTMGFGELMNTVAQIAFQTKNGRDPLFLHLRIKSENQPLLTSVAEILQNTFREKIYDDQVTKNTKLKSLIGKVVFIVDDTPNYASGYETILCRKKDKSCINLKDVVHMNSSDLLSMDEDRAVLQTPSSIGAIKKRNVVNIKKMQMTTPNLNNYEGANTLSFYKMIHNHGIQVSMHQFYINDDGLQKYKQFFEKQNAAFVPLSSAMAYISTHGGPED